MDEANAEPIQEAPQADAAVLLWGDPNVRGAVADLLRQVPTLWTGKYGADLGAARATQRWLLGWSFALTLIALAIAVGLAVAGIVSGEAVTFLLGTVVGSSVTVVREFFPLPRGQ